MFGLPGCENKKWYQNCKEKIEELESDITPQKKKKRASKKVQSRGQNKKCERQRK